MGEPLTPLTGFNLPFLPANGLRAFLLILMENTILKYFLKIIK